MTHRTERRPAMSRTGRDAAWKYSEARIDRMEKAMTDESTRFIIHVFDPLLNMTLYAHTYAGFAKAEDAFDHFLRMNPHHEAEHVSVERA